MPGATIHPKLLIRLCACASGCSVCVCVCVCVCVLCVVCVCVLCVCVCVCVLSPNITIGCYSFWQIGADHQGREEGRIKISQSHSS